MEKKKVVKVEITYEDGSMLRLTGDKPCQDWADMCEGQASMAYVHGLSYGPLPWEEVPAPVAQLAEASDLGSEQ